MEILYNFKKYDTPKFGIFYICTENYDIKVGWIQIEKGHKIIGETNDCYITHLLESIDGEWVGNIVIKTKDIIPLGIHKSRLKKWVGSQLTIFD